jgi:hypothetical protein
MTGGNLLSLGAEKLRKPRLLATTMAAVAAVVLGALITVSPASAASPPDARESRARTPQVTLEIPVQDVDAGAPFQVRVKSKAVGRAKVFLERRAAGTRNWVRALKVGKRGLFSAPGVSVGVYTYRLVVKKHGKILAKSKGHQLRSYANLTLQQYCSQPGVTVQVCADGTVPVGGSTFVYHASANNTGIGPEVSPSAEFTNSSCRRITLSYAVSNGSAAGASVSLTQDKGGTPQQSDVTAGSIGAATFAVGSKGWNLRFWTTPAAAVVYWDATLNCFTSNGFRQK